MRIAYTIILCLNFCLSGSKSIGQSIEFADQMYEKGSFRIALKEYLKIYYFDRNSELPYACMRAAKCFDLISDDENAIKYYKKLKRYPNVDPQKSLESQYEVVKIYLKNENFKLAQAEMYNWEQYEIEMDEDRYNFYMSMILLHQSEFDVAQEYISNLSYYHSLDTTLVQTIFDKMLMNSNKKHGGAKVLSAIIPGMGQVVNGEWKDGLNSAVLNGALIWVFVDVAMKLTTVDAFISVGPWLGRYYIGGLKNAEKASIGKQERRFREYKKELLEQIFKYRPN